MKQRLNQIFVSLLDKSGCLGVGLLDKNGLLIQSSGEHEGLSATTLAAVLAALYNPSVYVLERALSEGLDDQIFLGQNHHIHLSKISRQYIIYGLAAPDISTGKVRLALRQTKKDLKVLLKGDELFTPTYQRLTQPRQFANNGLVGAGAIR